MQPLCFFIPLPTRVLTVFCSFTSRIVCIAAENDQNEAILPNQKSLKLLKINITGFCEIILENNTLAIFAIFYYSENTFNTFK